jgi:methyl-accepting chemotaxis protein
MDNVTQQNAALVEQAAAAAQSLQEEAGNLSQVVSIFRLEGMQDGAMRAAKPRESLARKPSMGVAAVAGKPVAVAKIAAPRPASAQVAKAPFVQTAKADDWEEF